MEYISDKKVYASVMFAKKLLAQGKEFTNAVGIASHYYNVDYDEVRKYTSQRKDNKPKQASIKEGTKFVWYILGCYKFWEDEDSGSITLERIAIKRRIDKQHAEHYGREHRAYFDFAEPYLDMTFNSKKEAEIYLKEHESEIISKLKEREY